MKDAVKHNTFGFTIVELLVVIVVIGILAAITMVSYAGVNSRAIATSLQSDLSNGSKKLKLYQVEYGSYPTMLDANNCPLLPVADTTKYCIQLSSDNELETYSGNSTSFKLIIAKSTTQYQITENSAPGIAGDTTFAKAYGGTLSDNGASLIQTADGGFAVTGYTGSYGAGGNDAFLSKYNSDGVLSWTKTWGGTGSEYSFSVIQTNDGGFATTGETSSFGAGGYSVGISKFTSDGTLSWHKLWGGTGYKSSRQIIQTSDGGFATAGGTDIYGAGGGNNYDVALSKYTSDGTLSWVKLWGGTADDSAGALVQTSDGGYALAGSTKSFGGGINNSFLAKYTSDGTLSWVKAWGGANYTSSYSLVQTNDGGFAVSGNTNNVGAGGFDTLIAKYTSDGTLSWSKTWGGSGTDQSTEMIQTNDGGLALTGQTTSFGAGSSDMFIAKYTLDGNLSWNKTWGSAGYDYGYSIIQTSDSGFAVTGFSNSFGAGNYDVFIVKYLSDGTIANCSSPICQSPTSITNTFTPTVISPSPILTTPSPAIFTPSPTITNPTFTTSVVIP